MKIVFRADASRTIGSGHVRRCMTLAEALQARGAAVLFVCREHEGHMCDLLEKRGHSVTRLPAPPEMVQDAATPEAWIGGSWEEDARQTRSAIGEWGGMPDWLVVDHYALDRRWENDVRAAAARVMAIDDAADREHDCDLLLDQNIIADMFTRYVNKVPDSCALLLGPSYALLQPAFAELHDRTPPREGPIRRVLVSFGGADNANLTGRTVAAFLRLERQDIVVDVVVDAASPGADDVRRQAAGHPNINVHSELPTLAAMMARADLAVGGGGATSWERLCLGLPSLIITLAENQRPIAAALNARRLARWLGDAEDVDESSLSAALAEAIAPGSDSAWSRRCLEAVDGKGTSRVCAALEPLDPGAIRVRPAKLEDERLLSEWASDPRTYRHRSTSDALSADGQRAWLYDRLRDPIDSFLYVLESEDGVPLGVVGFRRKAQRWEADCVVPGAYDQPGVSRSVLELGLAKLRADVPGLLALHRSHDGAAGPTSGTNGSLRISICSDAGSWINRSIPGLMLDWTWSGHQVSWVHSASDLEPGDICFYLSYGRIVNASIRERHANNLVVHASDLPRGRGWSPVTWQIIEGESRIPITLFEAADAVDSGAVYMRAVMEFSGLELIDEIRAAVADATRSLCMTFVREYPAIVQTAVPQSGEPTFYPRRRAADSRIDIDRTLREQFNLLRTVDSAHYPAWFEIGGRRFALKVENLDG